MTDKETGLIEKYDRQISPAVAIGILITVAWAILVLLFFIFSSPD